MNGRGFGGGRFGTRELGGRRRCRAEDILRDGAGALCREYILDAYTGKVGGKWVDALLFDNGYEEDCQEFRTSAASSSCRPKRPRLELELSEPKVSQSLVTSWNGKFG